MNKSTKPRKTATQKMPKRSIPETPPESTVSTQVPTLFTNPDFFAQGD